MNWYGTWECKQVFSSDIILVIALLTSSKFNWNVRTTRTASFLVTPFPREKNMPSTIIRTELISGAFIQIQMQLLYGIEFIKKKYASLSNMI